MNVITIIATLAGLWFTAIFCQAQTRATDIAVVDSCMTANPKPILVLLSTDWCSYCQMQKSQLRKNTAFQMKSDVFYYIEFDAESKETIHWQGKDYAFKPTGVSTGVHELAIALNDHKKLAFPTWILLDKDYQLLFRHKGVLTPKQLTDLLQTMDKIKENNKANTPSKRNKKTPIDNK